MARHSDRVADPRHATQKTLAANLFRPTIWGRVTDMSEAKAHLATALHAAADLLTEREHSPEACEDVLALVESGNKILQAGTEKHQDVRLQEFAMQMVVPLGAPIIEDGDYFEAFNASPYSGKDNALRPTSVRYRRVGAEVHGEVVLGIALEGAPGRAHGGATAALFDDLMGATQRVTGLSGYTRSLEVSYLGPMPTDQMVSYRAYLSEQSQDTFTIEAVATHDSQPLAKARGVFTLSLIHI